jgi:hypothetical protein
VLENVSKIIENEEILKIDVKQLKAKKNFPNFFKFIRNFITEDEQREIFIQNLFKIFFSTKDFPNPNEVFKFIEELFDNGHAHFKIKTQMLLENDYDDKTILHKICDIKNEIYLKVLIEKYKKYVSSSELVNLLKQSRHDNLKPLFKIVHYNKNTKIVKLFTDYLQETLSHTEMHEILLLTDSIYFLTILQHTVLEASARKFKLISEMYLKYFTNREIQDIFLNNTELGTFAFLQKFVQSSIKNKIAKNVVKFVKSVFGDCDENLRKFLLQTDCEGCTIFEIEGKRKNLQNLRILKPLMNVVFEFDEIDELLRGGKL